MGQSMAMGGRGVMVDDVRVSERPIHRSFRLTRSGAAGIEGKLAPPLVLEADIARSVLDGAVRHDVAVGGRWSVWAGGLQLWTGPWDGPAGSRGSAQYLGAIDWSHDQPRRYELTILRVRLSPAGVAAGLTSESLVKEALSLGLS